MRVSIFCNDPSLLVRAPARGKPWSYRNARPPRATFTLPNLDGVARPTAAAGLGKPTCTRGMSSSRAVRRSPTKRVPRPGDHARKERAPGHSRQSLVLGTDQIGGPRRPLQASGATLARRRRGRWRWSCKARVTEPGAQRPAGLGASPRFVSDQGCSRRNTMTHGCRPACRRGSCPETRSRPASTDIRFRGVRAAPSGRRRAPSDRPRRTRIWCRNLRARPTPPSRCCGASRGRAHRGGACLRPSSQLVASRLQRVSAAPEVELPTR